MADLLSSRLAPSTLSLTSLLLVSAVHSDDLRCPVLAIVAHGSIAYLPPGRLVDALGRRLLNTRDILLNAGGVERDPETLSSGALRVVVIVLVIVALGSATCFLPEDLHNRLIRESFDASDVLFREGGVEGHRECVCVLFHHAHTHLVDIEVDE